MAHQINSDAASKYNSSPNYDQTEPTQDNQYKSSAATEFTFDNSQLFNTVMAPSERSLQMQNFNTFPHAMVNRKTTNFILFNTDLFKPIIPLCHSMRYCSALNLRFFGHML